MSRQVEDGGGDPGGETDEGSDDEADDEAAVSRGKDQAD